MMDAALFHSDLMIAYCGNPLDRAENRRGDEDWLLKACQKGRFLAVRSGKVAVHGGMPPTLFYSTYAQMATLIEAQADCVFLGVQQDQTPLFAVRCPKEWELPTDAIQASRPLLFLDGRSLAMQFSSPAHDQGITGIVAQALAILSWHARHRFCARCSSTTVARRGGYQRYCEACNSEHYPRTDPVAIMVPVRGDFCLLGRQPTFPPGMYSALAGFVESGESLEAAVRREVHEEAGIVIGGVSYVAVSPGPSHQI
ncbi:NADH pyrophosphatase [Iodidimonas gelatinilytica]|uniref:NADH pyrophosphatase n=1 Tax=Iodidimonas gelatinilytica TaxID=1236966 RepID=A0A5A7MSA7_9PROT|nr:NUDIX domain-containing protein [Iodidimonas gelatinilytica]GEQ98676.1 NADH pyrophosphatase [Iodidimonas gelatinilytica]